jgi:hypothetical protein
MVTKDPIEIWEIQKDRAGHIKYLVTREGERLKKDHVVKEIKDGQDYLISSEDGDNSSIAAIEGDILRTVKDDTELNNLTGNTNLKITILDEDD